MKKYSKPDLFFESYSLMGSIANTCAHIINSADIETCAADVEGLGMVFVDPNNGCEVLGIDDKICAAGGAVDVLGLSGS